MAAEAAMESPIAALSQLTKDKLSLLLNGKKILLSDNGFSRDWRGLAQCLDCDNDEVQQFGRSASPTTAVLESRRTLKVERLRQALELIGRHDAWDDSEIMIIGDASSYQSRLSASEPTRESAHTQSDISDLDVICVGDAESLRENRPLPTFDAFLLYDDGDASFAAEIIRRMEARGLKLCDKERHLLPGVTFEHQGIIRLMQTRCSRVLAVLSPQFLSSNVNTFLAMFAQAMGLDKRGRILVPCVYQKCTLPSYLMYCARLDFTRGAGLVNVWDKMYDTLSVAAVSRNRSVSERELERPRPPVARSSPLPASKSSSGRELSVSAPSAATYLERDSPSPGESRKNSRGLLSRLRGRLRGDQGPAEESDQPPGAADLQNGDSSRQLTPPAKSAQTKLSRLFKDPKKQKEKTKKKKAAKEALLA